MNKTKVKITVDIKLPHSTKVITNDGDWFTVARLRNDNIIMVLTVESKNAANTDFFDDSNYMEFRKDEIRDIAKAFLIK